MYVNTNTSLSNTQDSFNVHQVEDYSSLVYFEIDYDVFDGNYYINNKETGQFMNAGGNLTNGYHTATDTYSGNSAQQWRLVHCGNDEYYITSRASGSHILYASSSSVYMSSQPSNPGNAYKWKIILYAYNDSYTLQNVATGKYLALINGVVTLSATKTTKCIWRLCKTSDFEPLDSFTVADVACRLGESANYTISKNSNATWSSYTDFSFSSSSSWTVNYNSHTISSNVKGKHQVTATHKPTGETTTFDLVVYRPAVFLIHGRSDNSITVWGASTEVWVDINNTDNKANNHYNATGTLTHDSYAATSFAYNQVYTQRIQSYYWDGETVEGIFNGEYTENGYIPKHSEGGNLAFYLQSQGYVINEDLFVFNYPNQDAVIHNATKFNQYLDNLSYFVRTSGDKYQKLSLYGKTDGLTANTPLNIHIVGHSMGGLVARYYIENIGKDENVEKLITIGTPHWGSGLAAISDYTSILHRYCDHDLITTSPMYSSSDKSTTLGICLYCNGTGGTITPRLLYNCNRRTLYYAIAGISYDSYGTSNPNLHFELSNNISSYSELYNSIHSKTNNSLFKLYSVPESDEFNKIYLSPDNEGDNVVEFLSQIGWKDTSGTVKIEFEKIFVNIDASIGNNIVSHFHGKMPHREVVMQTVFEYLSS